MIRSTGTSFPRVSRSAASQVLLAALLAAWCSPGSAVPREPTDEFMIDSDPPGASVVIKPDGIRCKTPCKLELVRQLDYVIEYEMPGYASASVHVVAGSDQFRAEKHLKPNPAFVQLVRTAPLPPPEPTTHPAHAPPSPPLPDPVASLDNCIQPAAVDREACLGRIKLRMPKADVVAVLGPPEGTSRDESTLRYGDRYLKFDSSGRLVTISDRPL